jgi:uncharacterized protein
MGEVHGAGCGSSRRRFLKSAAATGAVLAGADSVLAAEPEPPVPTVALGKTGQTVTKLGMGTSWALTPTFVNRALLSGVRYIDTSEAYEGGNAERVVGGVLERTGLRKQVYLVTKTTAYRRASGPEAAKVFETHLTASLERLHTDYVDCFYIHGIAGKQIPMLSDPDVKAAFERLKKDGKIRFCGLSCHDAQLPEILEAAAKAGWLDQVMFQYNFRIVNHDALQRAVDTASKAKLGMVAMKTQKGAESFPQKIAELQAKGFKKEVAAIKSVWMDQRMQVVVSEMTKNSDLKENIDASREPLTPKEARLLEEHRERTANMYCHGCGHLCETAAKGVPVATVLRYLRYYSCYGKRQEARALYQALPPEARDLGAADLAAAEAACPHGLPVANLVQIADRRLG